MECGPAAEYVTDHVATPAGNETTPLPPQPLIAAPPPLNVTPPVGVGPEPETVEAAPHP
jgi:hypothetical protein